MPILKRRTSEPTAPEGPVRTASMASDGAGPAPAGPASPRWHGPTRAMITLLAVALAGFLAWLTTKIGDKSTGGYWAEYGILAGAGLGIALSQLAGGWTKWGRPRISPMVFLLAFVPALVAVGWIVVLHQPHSNWFRSHVMTWSSDIGVRSFVDDMGGDLLTMLSFGLGLVFGLSFDTTGRVPTAPARQERAVEPAASEPTTREREVVRS